MRSFLYTSSGVDIAQLLEYMNFSEKYVDLVRNSSAGNWAITYALYKIFTPLRYTVTVGRFIVLVFQYTFIYVLYFINNINIKIQEEQQWPLDISTN